MSLLSNAVPAAFAPTTSLAAIPATPSVRISSSSPTGEFEPPITSLCPTVAVPAPRSVISTLDGGPPRFSIVIPCPRFIRSELATPSPTLVALWPPRSASPLTFLT